MLDDFVFRALVGGIGIALVAAPLGCFVVWRRMAYFGDTMAHAALLGVALGLLLEVGAFAGVLAVTVALAFMLLALQTQSRVPTDTLLGILSHSSLSIGLVVVAFMTWLRIDLIGYLFGDVLAVSRADLLSIYLGGAAVLAVLALIWRPLLALTVNEEMARSEGVPTALVRIVFMLLIAVVIAISMRVVGILLITALLIIPPAAARRFASTPEGMAGLAALFGVAAVMAGLWASLTFDTPSGPSIVVASLAFFLVSLLPLPGRAGA